MTRTKPQNAAVYTRISSDPSESKLGVARQERECRALAERKGWDVSEVFVDNDVSATNGRGRPAYGRLLDAIRSGQVDAVVCWDADRLHRHPRELETFFDVCDAAGIGQLATVAGDVDLATGEGILVTRIKGAVAAEEVRKISRRLVSKHAELAEAGKPSGGGRRPFGYRQGGMEIEPGEAELVREAVDKILAGMPLRSVVQDWNERGVRTVSGVAWSATTMRRMLRSGRISGQREHGDRIVGPATWPAIIDPLATVRVRAIFEHPDRLRGRRGESPYLLSGLLRCGACGARMVAKPRSAEGVRVRRYYCSIDRGGCNGVGIIAEPLEQLVAEDALIALDGPAVRRALAKRSKPKNGAEAEVRRLEGREAELAGMWAAGELTKAAWSAARDRLARELEEARARVAGRVTEDAAAELVGKGASLAKQWPSLDIERRRAVIRVVLEAVIIAPVTRAHNRFDPERISYVWRA